MGDDQLGPICCVVAEFPGGRFSGRGFGLLLDAVDKGLVRVLDLEFVAKDTDGGLRSVTLSEIPNPEGVDLSEWEGASSGLLDRSDLDGAGAALEPGSVAGILVFENVWALSLAEKVGARIVSASSVSADELLAALAATDCRPARGQFVSTCEERG
jgi:Family of unknown function (DUF6325)